MLTLNIKKHYQNNVYLIIINFLNTGLLHHLLLEAC